jgi:hypothetical protein
MSYEVQTCVRAGCRRVTGKACVYTCAQPEHPTRSVDFMIFLRFQLMPLFHFRYYAEI